MADRAKKGSELPVLTGLNASDKLFAISANLAVNNATVNVSVLFGNFSANLVVKNGYSLVVAGGNTPANSTAIASVLKGTIWNDDNFVYVATANGAIKRAAISTF